MLLSLGSIEALRRSAGENVKVRAAIVHQRPQSPPRTTALKPGISALDVDAFLAAL